MPSKAKSTPALRRTLALPISISIARRARTGIRHHWNEAGSLHAGLGHRIGNGARSELPPPAVELVAMQPVAQRDLARLRTGRLRYLLRHVPTAPSRCLVRTSTRRKLCLSIGKLLGTRPPCIDQTRQVHPIATTRRNVRARLRLPNT